jgi:predicted metalloprotease with PDZ domain
MLRRLALPLALLAAPAAAQVPAGNSAPRPLPVADTIPAVRDLPYPGRITIEVDATDTRHRVFQVRETIPVAKSGPITLLYPRWIPGGHTPRAEIEKLAGLVIRGNGRVLEWTRDPVDMAAFHLDVPAGVRQLDVRFQFLSATRPAQGRVVMTPDLVSLQWIALSLYPAGHYARQIPVQASARFPDGFSAASGLPSRRAGALYTFEPTNYEVLIDSPVLAGRYYRAIPLSDRVTLDVFADTPAELAATPEQVAAHRRLVEQALAVFGAQHYDRYHFLLSISDQLGGIGLEHHRSSEDGTGLGYFTQWAAQSGSRDLLPHEYAHSWNGKFRRGADLWTPDYRTPMRNSLLWVYEGQTQFWGYVLQARAGLVSKAETLDQLAMVAASYDTQPARRWRDLLDTTNDPILALRTTKGWTSWQRDRDYYNEGLLVWLEVDAILRRESGGARSIDDFARAFFGVRDGDWGELTYTFDDLVATLHAVQPYDWAGHLRRRLTEQAAGAPLGGFTGNGYRLAWSDQPTAAFRAEERGRKRADLTYSGGLTVGAGGEVGAVLWDGAAFKAGLTPGAVIVAVDGQAYSDDRLRAAIAAAKGATAPVRLTVRDGDRVFDAALDWHDGLRYPRLEKTGSGEGGLDRLLAPR